MTIWTSPDLFDLLDISGSEDYRTFGILWFEQHAVAKTHAQYQFHARPSISIIKSIRSTGLELQLCIRTAIHDWVPLGNPLSLLSLGIDKGCPFFLKYSFADPGESSRRSFYRILDIFENYTETAEYHEIIAEKTENIRHTAAGLTCPENDTDSYRNEFDSSEQEFVLLKLVIENFILKNILRIEERVRRHTRTKEIRWEGIDHVFRSILFEKGAGIFSLSNALDNLWQIREISENHPVHEPENHHPVNYRDLLHDWNRLHMAEWRERQNRRINYFYDRESVYYRDLFLCVLLRDPERLIRFNSQWGSRLDHSIGLRQYIDPELDQLREKLRTVLPDTAEPEPFDDKIESNLTALKEELGEYTGFLTLLKKMRIYLV